MVPDEVPTIAPLDPIPAPEPLELDVLPDPDEELPPEPDMPPDVPAPEEEPPALLPLEADPCGGADTGS
jgi:hypothetical protein